MKSTAPHCDLVHVVITGGPCAGKTSTITKIAGALEKAGYGVIVAPETPTLLRDVRVLLDDAFQDLETRLHAFQVVATRVRAHLYEHCHGLAREMGAATGKTYVVLHDRGIWDGAAYVGPDAFGLMLDELEMDRRWACERYDLIVHMATTSAFYTRENNAARTEKREEALLRDRETRRAWAAHPARVIVEEKVRMEDKVEEVLQAVLGFLRERQDAQASA